MPFDRLLLDAKSIQSNTLCSFAEFLSVWIK